MDNFLFLNKHNLLLEEYCDFVVYSNESYPELLSKLNRGWYEHIGIFLNDEGLFPGITKEMVNDPDLLEWSGFRTFLLRLGGKNVDIIHENDILDRWNRVIDNLSQLGICFRLLSVDCSNIFNRENNIFANVYLKITKYEDFRKESEYLKGNYSIRRTPIEICGTVTMKPFQESLEDESPKHIESKEEIVVEDTECIKEEPKEIVLEDELPIYIGLEKEEHLVEDAECTKEEPKEIVKDLPEEIKEEHVVERKKEESKEEKKEEPKEILVEEEESETSSLTSFSEPFTIDLTEFELDDDEDEEVNEEVKEIISAVNPRKPIKIIAIRKNLNGIDLSHKNIVNSIFRRSKLKQSTFYMSNIINSEITNCDLTLADFSKTKTRNINFSHSKLLKSNLDNSRHNNAIFDNVNLRYSNIHDVVVKNASFIGTFFGNAHINKLRLTDKQKVSILRVEENRQNSIFYLEETLAENIGISETGRFQIIAKKSIQSSALFILKIYKFYFMNQNIRIDGVNYSLNGGQIYKDGKKITEETIRNKKFQVYSHKKCIVFAVI